PLPSRRFFSSGAGGKGWLGPPDPLSPPRLPRFFPFLSSSPGPPAASSVLTAIPSLGRDLNGQPHFSVMPTSPGNPPGYSTISTLSLYPRGRKYFAQST